MSGGANTALYVVDDPTALSGAESAVQGRLVAAGLTVTLYDNGDPIPSDADTYSLIVIAKGNGANLANPTPGSGPGKYALTTAPILWMHASGSGAESALFDHYLVSATTTSVSSAVRTNNVITVHQSTGNLPTGSTNFSTISSGGTKYYSVPSTMLAAAVVRLRGEVFNTDPVAWTFESCDDLRIGTAPNRRMVLLWFGPFLEFATADATTALDGAIAWCRAGVPCAPAGGWVVGLPI